MHPENETIISPRMPLPVQGRRWRIQFKRNRIGLAQTTGLLVQHQSKKPWWACTPVAVSLEAKPCAPPMSAQISRFSSREAWKLWPCHRSLSRHQQPVLTHAEPSIRHRQFMAVWQSVLFPPDCQTAPRASWVRPSLRTVPFGDRFRLGHHEPCDFIEACRSCDYSDKGVGLLGNLQAAGVTRS